MGFFFDSTFMHAEFLGLVPDIYFNNYLAVFIHHNLASRVAVYFLFAHSCLIFFLKLLLLLCHIGRQLLRNDRSQGPSLLLQPILSRISHGGPCLRMFGTGKTGVCLRPRRAPESGKLGTACRLLLLPQLHAPPSERLPGLNDDIDQNTNNLSNFINVDNIKHGTINHDYNGITLGYIDIGIKCYTTSLASTLVE
jgi:hypothetical protein